MIEFPAEATSSTRIVRHSDIERGVSALVTADPGLQPVVERAGPIPLRLRPPGFEGLARIVVGQQVSVASADAIWSRFETALDKIDAETVTRTHDTTLRECGLSGAKIKTLRAMATETDKGLDLIALADAPAETAFTRLTALPGIGPWSAEVYLMFCAGHPDIFPAGDVALQSAVQDAHGLQERPAVNDLRKRAERWRPWRSVAARIFWAYYRAMRAGNTGLPV